jgi:hypothetical protein
MCNLVVELDNNAQMCCYYVRIFTEVEEEKEEEKEKETAAPAPTFTSGSEVDHGLSVEEEEEEGRGMSRSPPPTPSPLVIGDNIDGAGERLDVHHMKTTDNPSVIEALKAATAADCCCISYHLSHIIEASVLAQHPARLKRLNVLLNFF